MKKIWIAPMIMEVAGDTSPVMLMMACAILRYQEEELALLLYGNYVADAPPPRGIFASETD